MPGFTGRAAILEDALLNGGSKNILGESLSVAVVDAFPM